MSQSFVYFLVWDDKHPNLSIVCDLFQSYPELMKVGDELAVIHTARFLPAGLHLYDIVSGMYHFQTYTLSLLLVLDLEQVYPLP